MQKTILAIFWIILATMGRIFPHPLNFTPVTGLSLFGGSQLPRRFAFITTVLAMFGSDLLLAKIHGYPLFGIWSFFTYSGFLLIVFLGSKLSQQNSPVRLLGFTVGASLFYWTWTNFGVWLSSGMYPKTSQGFVSCYIAAIPFLQNSLLGDLVWTGVLFGSFALVFRFAKTTAVQSV